VAPENLVTQEAEIRRFTVVYQPGKKWDLISTIPNTKKG
jgi:hypothetical protein